MKVVLQLVKTTICISRQDAQVNVPDTSDALRKKKKQYSPSQTSPPQTCDWRDICKLGPLRQGSEKNQIKTVHQQQSFLFTENIWNISLSLSIIPSAKHSDCCYISAYPLMHSHIILFYYYLGDRVKCCFKCCWHWFSPLQNDLIGLVETLKQKVKPSCILSLITWTQVCIINVRC